MSAYQSNTAKHWYRCRTDITASFESGDTTHAHGMLGSSCSFRTVPVQDND
jgi:hypothetical protein